MPRRAWRYRHTCFKHGLIDSVHVINLRCKRRTRKVKLVSKNLKSRVHKTLSRRSTAASDDVDPSAAKSTRPAGPRRHFPPTLLFPPRISRSTRRAFPELRKSRFVFTPYAASAAKARKKKAFAGRLLPVFPDSFLARKTPSFGAPSADFPSPSSSLGAPTPWKYTVRNAATASSSHRTIFFSPRAPAPVMGARHASHADASGHCVLGNAGSPDPAPNPFASRSASRAFTLLCAFHAQSCASRAVTTSPLSTSPAIARKCERQSSQGKKCSIQPTIASNQTAPPSSPGARAAKAWNKVQSPHVYPRVPSTVPKHERHGVSRTAASGSGERPLPFCLSVRVCASGDIPKRSLSRPSPHTRAEDSLARTPAMSPSSAGHKSSKASTMARAPSAQTRRGCAALSRFKKPRNAWRVSGRSRAGEVISWYARDVATATSSKSACGALASSSFPSASSSVFFKAAAAASALVRVARASAVSSSPSRSAYDPPVSFPMASSMSFAERAESLASAPAFSFSFSALNCASVPKNTVG
mmetsp:Transcript_3073/g.12781  ORF Transcript_3073/g.12781 Transcript_3073/m.12781 type:complete len:528 (-) Transcript_3073:375-1958(-)